MFLICYVALDQPLLSTMPVQNIWKKKDSFVLGYFQF